MNITFRAGEWMPAKRPLPEGQGFVAIGDVHGCDDQLAALHEGIRAQASELAIDPAQFTVVNLGDYMDRGPKCIEALDRIMAHDVVPGATYVDLFGNHEDLLVKALDFPGHTNWFFWVSNGGAQVVHQLGCKESDTLVADARAALGDERLSWIRGLPYFHRIGDWYFCHAGIAPMESLSAQSNKVLMWVRYEFLNHPGPFDKNVCVVHGHTPGPPDVYHDHRVSLDSGSFYTGVLTGLLVLGDRMRLLQSGTPEGFEKVDEWGERLRAMKAKEKTLIVPGT